jgi:transporter family-2 protein
MTVALLALLALLIGFGASVQLGMISSIGRLRGPTEAAWINVLATFFGMAIVFGLAALRNNPPNLPAPFDNPLVYGGVAMAAAFALLVSMRDLAPYLGIAGVFGFTYLMGAGYLAPRIGLALFASAVTAGTLIGSVALDHYGAFGSEIHRVSVMRVGGLALLIVGVVLVRASR